MERIKNIYCWDSLRDWYDAQNMGIVHIKAIQEKGGMFEWKQLLHMMYADCFPQCFLCLRKNNENYLLLTKEQGDMIDFISDRMPIQQEGTSCFFSEFPAEYRSKVLNAQVDSIWIRLDENENIHEEQIFR